MASRRRATERAPPLLPPPPPPPPRAQSGGSRLVSKQRITARPSPVDVWVCVGCALVRLSTVQEGQDEEQIQCFTFELHVGHVLMRGFIRDYAVMMQNQVHLRR